jgi:hypothetical protein
LNVKLVKVSAGLVSCCVSRRVFDLFRLVIVHGPCATWNQLQSSKHHHRSSSHHQLRSDDFDVDLVYFEVFTDIQEFCGQSAIPLTSLRTGLVRWRLSRVTSSRFHVSSFVFRLSSFVRHSIGSAVRPIQRTLRHELIACRRTFQNR